ncbi:unnamed protein product [Caenorhabditis bovis]|uniref:Peptidase M14 domain-containing protein n=1 Tax=Caenorhabditis bovis TaxID=2654633 RepID=A0A8S1E954_9PELO|nr:unnamed protein product [Caenorhabditis bovis]
MSPYSIFILIVFTGFCCAGNYEVYKGYKYLNVDISTQRSRRYIQDIEKNLGFMPDFLGESRKKRQANFFVDGESANKIRSNFDQNNITYHLKDVDLNTFKTRRRRELNQIVTINDVNSRYLSYEEQMQFINTLSQSFPRLMKLQNLGNSFEGRPITSVRLGEDNPSKPIVWIDAGMHAREWISYNVALHFIYTMLTDPINRQLLRRVTVVVVPNANPDGYEFSRTVQRMWRKTRSRNTNSRCSGADGNRNYPFYWGTLGVSHSTCSEIYCGTRPQSEPEVLALTNAIQSEETRIKAYLSLHSYGQEILYPWGHTLHTYPSDVNDLIRVGQLMANAIRSVSNTQYTVKNSGDGLYPAAGASDDWAKSRGIKYAYTMELSPEDDFVGFELPEELISKVNREALQGVLALVRVVSQDYGVAQPVAAIKHVRAFATRARAFGKG